MALAGLFVRPAVAPAQDRPFVFSLATATDASTPQVRVDYDIGVGELTLHGRAGNGPEQRFGVQASVGRLTFVGHVDIAAARDAYQTSQQGEMLVSLFAQSPSQVALAMGGGVLHEADGVNVLLARLVAGHEGTGTRLHGNLLFQKPLAEGRDNVDLITSMGWAARVTSTWAIGVEAIGEDLEGLLPPAYFDSFPAFAAAFLSSARAPARISTRA